ncbi:MAG: hypothetical protein AAFV27_12895, partial [Pseudomonadota bacterium]
RAVVSATCVWLYRLVAGRGAGIGINWTLLPGVKDMAGFRRKGDGRVTSGQHLGWTAVGSCSGLTKGPWPRRMVAR